MKIYNKLTGFIDSKWFVFSLLMSIGILINIPFAFSNSGVIAVYGTDIFTLIVIPYLLFDIFIDHKNYSKLCKVVFILSFIFVSYMGLVSLIRFTLGNQDLKSLLVPRVFITSVWILLLILRRKISKVNIEYAIVLFSVTLTLISIILFFTTAPIAYALFQNAAIRTTMQIILYPLVMYVIIKDTSLKRNNLRLLTLFFIVSGLIISGISSGSRINSFLVPINVIGSLFFYHKTLNETPKSILVGILVSLLFLVAVFPISYRYRVGSSRSILFKPMLTHIVSPFYSGTEMKDFFGEPRYSIPEKPSEDNSNNPIIDKDNGDIIGSIGDETDTSKEDSSSARFSTWLLAIEDISTNILFGPGLRYYEITYSTGSSHIIPPHNFILEYTLAYGLVGYSIFMLILLYPLKEFIKDNANSEPDYMFLTFGLLSILSIGANIFFQPLLLNPPVTLFMFFVLGVIVSGNREDNLK